MRTTSDHANPYRFALEIHDQFKLRPCNQHNRKSRHEGGHESDRNSPECRGDHRPNSYVIINLSIRQGGHGCLRPDLNNLGIDIFFPKKAFLLRQRHCDKMTDRRWITDPDLVATVNRTKEEMYNHNGNHDGYPVPHH